METVNTKINLRLKDYLKDVDEKAERRYFHEPLKFLEIEENSVKKNDENQIIGYAALFNSNSQDLGGFIERINPGAFDSVLNDDSYAYLNHSMNHPIGRNKVNMTLSVDDIGLRYVVQLPDTTDGNNVRTLVRMGIISQSSFSFLVEDDEVTFPDGQLPLRSINKFSRLFDVSPLSTDPGYLDTTVALRSLKREQGKKEIRMSLLEIRLLNNINKSKLKHLNKY